VIRLLEPDDGAELAALYTANWDFLAPFEPDRDDGFFTTAVQRRRIERMAGDEYWLWGIYESSGGAMAGMIALSDVVRGPVQMANVGYWVAREHNGRGLASAAVAEVAAFAFETAGLHRLEAATLPDNRASQRVLEKNGFTKFGTATKLLLIAGQWRDHVLFERVTP
jgi:[ribosomal protein S5]-alanine N-acetyltransferase